MTIFPFRGWLDSLLKKPVKETEQVWVVDRDGRVRKPERKIVLRSSTALPTKADP